MSDSTSGITNALQNNQYANKVVDTYKNSSTVQKIILAVVIIVAIYFIFRVLTKNSSRTQLLKDHNASKGIVIKNEGGSTFPTITGSEYAFSVWIFVNEWNYNYGQEKHIFSMYSKVNGEYYATPIVVLDKYANDLLIRTHYFSESGSVTGSEKVCKIESIPLQKWVHIIVSMNNLTLDVYMDGKLRNTCMLDNAPMSPVGSDIYVSGTKNPNEETMYGFSGKISDLKLFQYSLNPSEAYSVYRKGNSVSGISSLIDKYKLKVAVMENDKETSSYTF